MTLVKELRDIVAHSVGGSPTGGSATAAKAADEIERLQRELAAARADLKKIRKIIDERDDLYDLEEDIKAVLEGRYQETEVHHDAA